MTWPAPEPGLVIRYSYLWRREALQGHEGGVKDRPCAIVLTVAQAEGDVVYVLPVTHTSPVAGEDAVEIPTTKARLGLDSDRSWIVLTEANAFVWPGPDLRFTPGGGSDTIVYGPLPPALYRIVRTRFAAAVRARRAAVTRRTQ